MMVSIPKYPYVNITTEEKKPWPYGIIYKTYKEIPPRTCWEIVSGLSVIDADIPLVHSIHIWVESVSLSEIRIWDELNSKVAVSTSFFLRGRLTIDMYIEQKSLFTVQVKPQTKPLRIYDIKYKIENPKQTLVQG